jgi:death-on-curing protein
MMKRITVDQVVRLHETILKETGGLRGIRDHGAVESAVARPFSSFGGFEPYESKFAKAAALIHSLIKNHPFVDGNKRTGITAGVLFLWVNGCRLTATQEAFEETAVSIAESQMDLDEIAEWLKANVTEV